MCFYSRLQQQSTGGSPAPPPSQRLRRVHRATTDLLFPLHYIHVHIVISYSCNGDHDNPWCIIQCIILLACGRDLIFMLLDTKSIMSVFFPIQGTILALRVFGPSGPASCYGPLTEWDRNESGWDVAPPQLADSSSEPSNRSYSVALFLHASSCHFKHEWFQCYVHPCKHGLYSCSTFHCI